MSRIELKRQTCKTVISWFPWVTNDNCDVLDRNLSRKIAAGSASLIMPEILTALRWYESIPEGFRSEEDNYIASVLSEQLALN